MRDILRRIFGAPPPRKEVHLLGAGERDAIVATHLRAALPPLGLTEVNARKWVDGAQPPVRRVFELQLLKSAMKACWGFSLDFVPHLSGGHVRWHRSDKTALLDVIVDPRDLEQPSFLWGAAHLEEGLQRLLPEAVARAQETWRRGSSFEGLIELIREIRDQHTNCFAYRNYTQLPLAYAMLCAKTGDLATAEQELAAYAEGMEAGEAEKLKKLSRDCARA